MDAELAVKNCRIVNSSLTYDGVIYISGGKIIGISKSLEGNPREILDAKRLHVLPGAVDAHVHMMDPGFTDREDFMTGTRAAARGGVTTIIELPNQARPLVFTAEGMEEKKSYLSDRSVVDFGLLGGLSLEHKKDLRGMWEAGAVGFKGFTISRPDEQVLLPGYMAEIFEELVTFDGVALIHAEEDSILKYNEKKLKAAGRKDFMSVAEWRSRLAESLAVKQVVDVAEATGARVTVAHISMPALIQYIWLARGRGARVYAETCAQYLTLHEEDLAMNGPFHKFTPPMRSREESEGIWKSLRTGKVDMVNSDHVPLPIEEKEKGLEDIWEAPFGMPGVETTTRLLLDGVTRGLISINQVARLRSENAAGIYGLSDEKGFIEVGYDADLVFADLEKETVLEDKDVISKCKWTPYRGRKIQGDIVLTMVRGKVVMKDGEVTGSPGWGRFVTRAH
ncbi:MAG: amidohydrolase family protein [Deltaproteobacteria bacterium]|nr:amidohydrolase family protein [Deltaproteobacteria bacterium]